MRSRSRQMRMDPTPAEALTARILRGLYIRYRKQVIIGNYIADFVGVYRNFVLEVDGPIHDKQKDYDGRRDEYFRAIGLNVFRLKNNDISPESLHFLVGLPKVTSQYEMKNRIWLGNRKDMIETFAKEAAVTRNESAWS